MGELQMNRTYARSFAALLCLIVASLYAVISGLELWVLRQSTLPNIEALRPAEAAHTWKVIQPMLAAGANEQFAQSQVSGLVHDATALQEGWKAYVESLATHKLWELVAWSIVLICSVVLFSARREAENAA